MRQPLALAATALVTALLTVSAVFGATQASGAEAGKQCMSRPAQQSLVVRGKVTCKQVKKLLPTARELALVTQEHGYDRFTIRGFMCLLKPDYRRFACHDIDGTPKRSFVWIDRT